MALQLSWIRSSWVCPGGIPAFNWDKVCAQNDIHIYSACPSQGLVIITHRSSLFETILCYQQNKTTQTNPSPPPLPKNKPTKNPHKTTNQHHQTKTSINRLTRETAWRWTYCLSCSYGQLYFYIRQLRLWNFSAKYNGKSTTRSDWVIHLKYFFPRTVWHRWCSWISKAQNSCF